MCGSAATCQAGKWCTTESYLSWSSAKGWRIQLKESLCLSEHPFHAFPGMLGWYHLVSGGMTLFRCRGRSFFPPSTGWEYQSWEAEWVPSSLLVEEFVLSMLTVSLFSVYSDMYLSTCRSHRRRSSSPQRRLSRRRRWRM